MVSHYQSKYYFISFEKQMTTQNVIKLVFSISVRIFYYIIGQVITELGFITFSIRLSALFITFSGVFTCSVKYYIIRCYKP